MNHLNLKKAFLSVFWVSEKLLASEQKNKFSKYLILEMFGMFISRSKLEACFSTKKKQSIDLYVYPERETLTWTILSQNYQKQNKTQFYAAKTSFSRNFLSLPKCETLKKTAKRKLLF